MKISIDNQPFKEIQDGGSLEINLPGLVTDSLDLKVVSHIDDSPGLSNG